jgi:hypothetical protein
MKVARDWLGCSLIVEREHPTYVASYAVDAPNADAQGPGVNLTDLGRIPQIRRDGTEPFHSAGSDLGFDLLGFWKWSVSDLVSNATRGRLAEYIIATAIGAADGVRDEWAAYDLLDPRDISIEVKSAAYIQTWHQDRLSTISFNCAPSFAWDPETNRQSDVKRRQAEVCLCPARPSGPGHVGPARHRAVGVLRRPDRHARQA